MQKAVPSYPVTAKIVAMQTSANRQNFYRIRQVVAGAKRLDVFISSTAHHAIARKATADGLTQREVIERLALSEVRPPLGRSELVIHGQPPNLKEQ